MSPIVSIRDLGKTYGDGFEALSRVDLDIAEGEVLALLGPNGAGKTTLISCVCGISVPTRGTITVGGHDAIEAYRAARSLVGLVPQEINLEPFETVRQTVSFSRGLFGKPRDDARVDAILRTLSLAPKADSQIRELSGGMKRRVLIAKALAHEPRVLFLDEPTAGVDVELRRGMWETVEELRRDGVTIILTTHYIEEAEAIADRVAVIDGGRILLVEEKAALMARMGRKEMRIDLCDPIEAIPPALEGFDLVLAPDGHALTYSYDARAERTGIARLISTFSEAGLRIADVTTRQNSLEDIFVGLTHRETAAAAE